MWWEKKRKCYLCDNDVDYALRESGNKKGERFGGDRDILGGASCPRFPVQLKDEMLHRVLLGFSGNPAIPDSLVFSFVELTKRNRTVYTHAYTAGIFSLFLSLLSLHCFHSKPCNLPLLAAKDNRLSHIVLFPSQTVCFRLPHRRYKKSGEIGSLLIELKN